MSRTAVSLFAGVGGIDLALERAGFRVTTAVEINDAARGVLHDRFSLTTLRTDVTKVTADELRADGFDPDGGLVAAGFPCQDLSVAGRRKGMGAGTRSGLYWHVVRLLADLRPTWVLLENVPGLLSATCPCPGDGTCGAACPAGGEPHSVKGGACAGGCIATHGGAMGAVLGSLGELGYGFAYRVLDAQHFGVPQRRRRVVIVGCLGDDRRPVEVLLEPEGGERDSATGEQAGSRVAATLAAGAHGSGVSAPGRRAEDDVNLVIAPTLTARYAKGTDSDATDTMVVSALTANGVGTCGADDNQGQAGHLVTYQKTTRPATSDHPDVWEERGVAATLSPFDLGSDSRAVELVVQPLALRGRDPVMATAASALAGPPSGPRGRCADRARSDEPPPAVRSTHALATEATVRRLTPMECERLQGFPDGWTSTSNGKAQAASPRYQQMGNAVAVPVFEWVTRRIARAS